MEHDPTEPGRALGRDMDSWRVARARPEFKEGLRVRFVRVHERTGEALSAALDGYGGGDAVEQGDPEDR